MRFIGREIKEIARKESISLYQIAKNLGIAKESLHRSLKDDANPEWRTIQKVIAYLGYEVKFVKKINHMKRA
jgi:probable addiction module antidote protein